MKRPRAIVAIDPGVTTGVAWSLLGDLNQVCLDLLTEGNRGDVVEVKARDVPWGELDAANTIVDIIEAVDIKVGVARIVIEDFVLRRFTMGKEGLAPVRVTAYLEAELDHRLHCLDLIEKQGASSALGVVTDDRLKRWGAWVKGKPHGRAASKHLITAIRRNAGSIS